MKGGGGTVRISKRIVDAIDGSAGRRQVWDSDLKGFGLQVEISGTKTYIVRYRPKGLGRDGPRRFVKLGRHGAMTPEEARTQAKVILGSVAAGRDPVLDRRIIRSTHVERKNALTLSSLAEAFLRDHVAAKRKPSTAAYYRYVLDSHVVPQLGACIADEILRADVAKLHVSLRSNPHTANRALAIIGSMYSFAGKNGLVHEGHNPARGIEKYREEGRERYLSSEELGRLGSALTQGESEGIPWDVDSSSHTAKHVPKVWKGQRELIDPYASAALRLLILTGARLREILHLRWGEVDLEWGLLLLPDSKTGKKTIVLSDAAIIVLNEVRKRDALTGHCGRAGYVIKGSKEGRPRADLKRPWTAIQRHARLEGVRLHDLRHTFASIGAGASLGLPIVGKLLGHSQPQTTARYAHLDADPLRRATNIISDRLAAALQA